MAPHPQNQACEEYELPVVEAVLAGTLALMTGCAEARCATQRRRMMGRIVDHLELLAQHPQLSAPFRCAVGKLRGHWELLLQDGHAPEADPLRRHPAPRELQ